MSEVVLHDYWRSSASYRVRIALNHLGIAYRSVPIDILAGAHKSDDYREVNPQGLTVLADMAVPLDDFDRSLLAGQIKDAEEDVTDAKEDWQRDKLARKLEQLKALEAALGS